MKTRYALLVSLSLLLPMHAQAEGWLDSLKSLFGLETEESQPAAPNISDMVKMVTDNLGVEQNQAQGGLGAIFDYVKGNLDSEQFGKLSSTLPGIDELINNAPDVSNMSSAGSLGGLIDKASEYNESIKALNDVKKQFESLGLKPEMISQFIQQAKAYLDTEQGQQAKQLISQGVTKLLG